MDGRPRLMDMPPEVLAMILEEYFKISTLDVKRKIIHTNSEKEDIPEDAHLDNPRLFSFRRSRPDVEVLAAESSSRNGLAVLRTCRHVHQASQRFLLPKFLIQHATFHFSWGYDFFQYMDEETPIRISNVDFRSKDLRRSSCDHGLAWLLQQYWQFDEPPYQNLKDITVFYEARTEDEKPSVVGFRKVLADLIKTCIQYEIHLCIFVKIDGMTTQKASIKAIVEGLEVKVYEMKQMTRTDLAFFRRLFKKLFDCKLPAPDITWKRGQKVDNYQNATMQWQES